MNILCLSDDFERLLPWWRDVESSARRAMTTRPGLVGFQVAVICGDLYRFDSVSSSVTEQAVVLMTAGCRVHIVCNNKTGMALPFIVNREDFFPDQYDWLLYHYSIGDDFLEKVITCKVNKAVYYHGITTPPETYAPFSMDWVNACKKGLENLSKLRFFDRIFSSSGFNLEQVMNDFENKKNIPVPSAIFPPAVSIGRFSNKEERTRKEYPYHLLTVGRIFSSKNIAGVIVFAKQLADRIGKKIRLTIAGSKCEPDYVAHLLKMAGDSPQLKMDICLRFSDEEIRKLYKSADVYLCFSHHEGFCIPLIEAMAARLPIVTHEMTAIPETMSGTGILVNAYAYDEGVNKLLQTWSDPTQMEYLLDQQQSLLSRKYAGELIAGKLIDAVHDATFRGRK